MRQQNWLQQLSCTTPVSSLISLSDRLTLLLLLLLWTQQANATAKRKATIDRSAKKGSERQGGQRELMSLNAAAAAVAAADAERQNGRKIGQRMHLPSVRLCFALPCLACLPLSVPSSRTGKSITAAATTVAATCTFDPFDGRVFSLWPPFTSLVVSLSLFLAATTHVTPLPVYPELYLLSSSSSSLHRASFTFLCTILLLSRRLRVSACTLLLCPFLFLVRHVQGPLAHSRFPNPRLHLQSIRCRRDLFFPSLFRLRYIQAVHTERGL